MILVCSLICCLVYSISHVPTRKGSIGIAVLGAESRGDELQRQWKSSQTPADRRNSGGVAAAEHEGGVGLQRGPRSGRSTLRSTDDSASESWAKGRYRACRPGSCSGSSAYSAKVQLSARQGYRDCQPECKAPKFWCALARIPQQCSASIAGWAVPEQQKADGAGEQAPYQGDCSARQQRWLTSCRFHASEPLR
jgi:hypothetical protein